MITILQQWEIGEVASVEPIDSFTGKASMICTRDGASYILKEKPDPQAAEREAVLLARLAATGAPVAVPLRTRAGNYFAQENGKTFLLSPRLPGRPFTRHYRGQAILRAERYGRAIARLDSCLALCDGLPGFPSLHLIEHIHGWALPILRRHPAEVDLPRLEAAWKDVEEGLAPIYGRLPIQLIHRDAHPGNLLFQRDRLSGIIDFDMVTRGPRIFDLAYCGTSLLMAAYPSQAKMQIWPRLLDGLVHGYSETVTLTSEEKLALPGTMIAIELIYVALGLEIRAENVTRSNENLVYRLSSS
jgi:Ser/Thr protein kinase RdoA (MazF antagonist)